MLRWADEHFPGEVFVDWYTFDHPQLGPIELGGWDWLRSWINPPPGRLAEEVAGHADFAIALALASPLLELPLVEAQALGEGTWRVRAGIANTGWLPTTVTERARTEELVLPVVAELIGPAGLEVLDGAARRELGQLDGLRSLALKGGAPNDGTPERALVTWTVRAPEGTELVVEARHPRAGSARTTVRLTS